MSKVAIIIASETAKVRDHTLSRSHTVVVKGPALPLGKTEGNFQLDILKVPRGKGGGTFDAIEIVVESRSLRDKEGTGHTLKVDVLLELVFKRLLDETKRLFLGEKIFEKRLILVHYLLGWETGEGVFGVERGGHGSVAERVVCQSVLLCSNSCFCLSIQSNFMRKACGLVFV